MTAQSLVRIRSLTKTFGEGETRVDAVRGLDLELERGEIVLVMGPSGSGRTTFLSMLGGLLAPRKARSGSTAPTSPRSASGSSHLSAPAPSASSSRTSTSWPRSRPRRTSRSRSTSRVSRAGRRASEHAGCWSRWALQEGSTSPSRSSQGVRSGGSRLPARSPISPHSSSPPSRRPTSRLTPRRRDDAPAAGTG